MRRVRPLTLALALTAFVPGLASAQLSPWLALNLPALFGQEEKRTPTPNSVRANLPSGESEEEWPAPQGPATGTASTKCDARADACLVCPAFDLLMACPGGALRPIAGAGKLLFLAFTSDAVRRDSATCPTAEKGKRTLKIELRFSSAPRCGFGETCADHVVVSGKGTTPPGCRAKDEPTACGGAPGVSKNAWSVDSKGGKVGAVWCGPGLAGCGPVNAGKPTAATSTRACCCAPAVCPCAAKKCGCGTECACCSCKKDLRDLVNELLRRGVVHGNAPTAAPLCPPACEWTPSHPVLDPQWTPPAMGIALPPLPARPDLPPPPPVLVPLPICADQGTPGYPPLPPPMVMPTPYHRPVDMVRPMPAPPRMAPGYEAVRVVEACAVTVGNAVRLSTAQIEAQCQRINATGHPDEIVLEGNVQVTLKRGAPIKLSAERVVFNTRTGAFRAESAPAMPAPAADAPPHAIFFPAPMGRSVPVVPRSVVTPTSR